MKVLAWIIGVPIAIIALWGVGRLLFCEPDKSIQKVTDPMATAILEYINTHGRPGSLADIPNLPYKVEECKKLHSDDKSIYREQCSFIYNKNTYSILIRNYTRTDNGVFVECHIEISNRQDNTKSVYIFYQKKINTMDEIMYLSDHYVKSIHKSFLCKNGYLRMN